MYISKSFSFNRASCWTSSAGVAPSSVGNFSALRALWQRVIGAFAGRRVGGGALEHLATLPLGPQPSLVLVRLGQQTLLLGATAQRINLLAKTSSETGELGVYSDATHAASEESVPK